MLTRCSLASYNILLYRPFPVASHFHISNEKLDIIVRKGEGEGSTYLPGHTIIVVH